MTETFRQGHTHSPLEADAYVPADGATPARFIDFPAEFPGGVTARFVSGETVVTGPATGTSGGRLSYPWGATDLDVIGVYVGYFEGVDALGKTESFPRGRNLEYEVIPTV